MHILVVDKRQILPHDCRFKTMLKTLHETVILYRSFSKNLYFGISVIEENIFKTIMPLQDIKIQTVFELEKVFDLLNQIVTENIDDSEKSGEIRNTKVKNKLSLAMLNASKQLKELKGNKKKGLEISIISTFIRDGDLKHEIKDYLQSSNRDLSISQINILDLYDDVTKLFDTYEHDRFRFYFLPKHGFEIATESICKKLIQKRIASLKLVFPKNGPQLNVEIEEFFIDLHPLLPTTGFLQYSFPKELAIICAASLDDLSQSAMYGQCFMLSLNNKNPNSYLWNYMCKLIRNSENILIAREKNPAFVHALIPCSNSQLVLQRMASAELLLPTLSFGASNESSENFEMMAKTLPLDNEYGLGSRANIISSLKIY